MNAILTTAATVALQFSLSLSFIHRNYLSRHSSQSFLRATIALVGSGPGDPDLLTFQAIKLLNNASLVIADRLISPEILTLIKCELRIANKKPGCAEEAQEEIYTWVKEAIGQDRNVVRLKIGGIT